MSEEGRASDLQSRREGEPRTTVVGVGASAGGVNALQNFVSALPEHIDAALVIIAHLDPDSRSQLSEILAARGKMPAYQVNGTLELKPDCIYVIPPDRQLLISDDSIAAIPFEEPRGRRMPIDFFFRSLAEQHGDGFAVVLTGAGSDGAVGVKAIKEAGGIILVQDPEEAEYPPMPRAAIATEVADFVLPVKQLAEHLVELIRAKRQAQALVSSSVEETLRRILAHLRMKTGHDFSHYKRSTVLRRISRRVQVTQKEGFEEYSVYLRENPEEAQALLADLLISVTTFFRDPGAFAALARNAIPLLFENRDPTEPIRIWVAGCATGEEAYSIAILLLEEAARHEVRPEIHLFATDMDARALTVAREGVYPAAIEADVSDERLRRFFHADGDRYRVKRELRDILLFANHSLSKDPPFSRVDLISCRNLLIYLNRDLQLQVLTTFNYSLNREGFLFLGSSESAEHPNHLFRTVEREARLYQSTGRAEMPPLLPRLQRMTAIADHGIREPATAPVNARNAQVQHREALEANGPPSMVVDASYRVLHLSENAGRYLQPRGGAFSPDITELVREELRFELRRALHRAFERNESTLSPAFLVRLDGTPHRLHFQVKPVNVREAEESGQRALILFIEGDAGDHPEKLDATQAREAAQNGTFDQLQQELELAHARLRTMREESEAANEELRAANEELQSINEEYRSTAEELETSKEELQSINEELQTVNSELKLKLDTVSRANSDLQNLMAATDFGTLFLDTSLRIKRFTPRLAELFSITAGDVGRPITDFTHRLEYEGLIADARMVLEDLTPVEREVPSRPDGWHLVRLRPYRTVDDKIDGVVVTFLDVTERRRMEDALRASEARLRLLLSELTHRVKNILAVVQGIVRQAWRTSQSKQDFLDRMDGRLAALAGSNKLLIDSDWKGADLRKVIDTELSAYTDDPSRLRVSGDPVLLPADIATPIGLVLHELATNAIKYGALSNEAGRIELSWKLDCETGMPKLHFRWKEIGGPAVKEPSSSGFGSTLIRGGLPAAKVDHRFPASGVECDIELQLLDAKSDS